jgi:ABC-type branched-subunit amino acid transport system substrate-binding protein
LERGPIEDVNEYEITTIKIGVISASSEARALEDNVYRLSPNDDLEWRAMANILSSAGVKHILLVGRQGSWFQYEANETIKKFESQGGSTLLVSNLSFNESLDAEKTLEEMDEVLSGSLKGVDRGKISVVYYDFPNSWSIAGGDELLRELKDHPRLLNITWFGYSSTSNVEKYLRSVEDQVSKIKLIGIGDPSHSLSGEIYEHVNGLWQNWGVNEPTTTDDLSFYDASIYDSLWVACLSAIQAGGTNEKVIKSVLPTVAAEYNGATGRVYLDENGDRTGLVYAIYGYYKVGNDVGGLVSVRIGYYDDSSGEVTWVEGLFPTVK